MQVSENGQGIKNEIIYCVSKMLKEGAMII